jgi:hypothetical protein
MELLQLIETFKNRTNQKTFRQMRTHKFRKLLSCQWRERNFISALIIQLKVNEWSQTKAALGENEINNVCVCECVMRSGVAQAATAAAATLWS